MDLITIFLTVILRKSKIVAYKQLQLKVVYFRISLNVNGKIKNKNVNNIQNKNKNVQL